MEEEGNKYESEADVFPFNLRSRNTRLADKESDKSGSDDAKQKIKFDPDDFYYDMTGDKYLVIFNHYKYNRESIDYYRKPPENRTGTEKDVEALDATFKKLGFKVYIYHDKDRKAIWKILQDLRETDFSAASCLCIAILTHGSKNGELCAYDAPYCLDDVTQLFESHPSLAGKPKLFFIQACRGKNMDDGNQIATDGAIKEYFVLPTHADFLVVRSTVEDYMSYRDNRGSWMIQELCKMIQDYHEDLDILHIITLMHQKVAYAYSTYVPKKEEMHNKRQMPETTFTLTKICKFN